MQEVQHDPMDDLEMQLLSTVVPQAAGNHGGTKRIIHTAILVVQSLQMFLEGVSTDHPGSPPVSRVPSSSKSIDSSSPTDQQDDEKKQEVENASYGLAASSEHITINQLRRCQSKNISKIVHQKNWMTLHEFGGVDGVVDALGTDLVYGISGEALHQHQELTRSLAPPTRAFFHLVWQEIKNKTIVLLFVATALSILFEINEEGLENGWYDGVVVLIALVLQVLFASIHKYWKEHIARKNLQKKQSVEWNVKEVHVTRGGESNHICESELVCGDLVLLKKGCQVPADGLFVDGDDLELDYYGSESYINNEQNPFLSYGGRVVNGKARMIVTSTNHIMVSKAICCHPNMRFKLETHLDNLNTCMHYIRIVISLLILVVLFLRYRAGKIDDENVYRPESMAEPAGIRSFSNSFEKIIKESKYTTGKVLTKLLCVSLVGLTEGVPFVVTLAIVYWNDQILSAKATSQVISNMAAVTKICTDTFGEDDTVVQKLFIGGEFISEGTSLSHNIFEAVCDGIGISKENAFLHGAKLNRESMKQRQRIEESEDMILQFLNGPVNDILSKCTHYYNIQGEQVSMNDTVRSEFGQTNDDMECTDKLTTTAVACKHFSDTQTHEWVLVALLGLIIKNKEDIKAEVKACRECGIEIIIVSNKKLPVLKDIALQYGLITDDPQSLMLTGEDFRKYTDKERLQNVDKIRVLGEAFSSDKLLLIETLRGNGDVVVFLGQRADEAPALMGADIGIAVGRQSSKKAIESSDIIIRDDGSFSEIINMVDSGKCIYLNIQSYLQPVLITTVSSTLINFIQTAAWGDASLTVVQLVWVNSAILFLGGLALLTKLASTDKPVSYFPITCGRSLITAQMTRNILLQVSFQVTCLVIIQTKGSGIMGSSQYMKTLVFDIFVICQFFNLFNARELQKKNFFRCIHRHKEFWVAITAFMVFHAAFVAVQDILGYGIRLNWKLWGGCVLVGVMSWLVDCLGKCISWFIIEIFVNRFRNT